MVRSLENFPELATFRMAFRAQASGSAYNASELFVRLRGRSQVGQVHVEIAVGQERFAQGSEDSRLVPAEVIGEDQIQRRSRFRLVLIVPPGVIPAAAGGHLFRCEAEQEEILLARFFRHLDGGAVARADGRAPFIMNFMLLVPLAS